MIVTLIDIFMAVPLVLVPLGLALMFIYGVYKEYKTTGVVMLILFFWFFIALLYFTKPAHSAEATLNMQGAVISYADTVKICQADNPPHWCPEHLRKEKQPITKVQFDYTPEQINDGYALDRIQPASGDEIYE